MSPTPSSGVEQLPAPRWLKALAGSLFTLGAVVRLIPLFDWKGRLLETFPTEDGYFMLTVGRNMSLGLGMSVAGGETPTNGVQPLVTFLWALAYRLVGGDRVLGVFVALLFELAIACVTAYATYLLARRVLASRPYAHGAGLLAASTWFASPVSLPHTMNCLETGAYALVATLVARAFAGREDDDGTPWGYGHSVAVGVLLGVAFWTRNDAVFLILAACLVYLAGGWPIVRAHLSDRLGRTLVFGATSVLVASPWLVHNYLGFGHIMPISGRAESLGATFAENLGGIPIVLFEVVGVVLPLPHTLEQSTGASIALGVVVAGFLGVLVWRRNAFSSVERRYGMLVGIYTICIAAFYGLYFGASYFLNRYVHPLSPLFAVITCGLVMALVHGLRDYPLTRLYPVGAGLLVVALTLLSVRYLRQTEHHQHFQVIRWVEENVPDDTWVAAIQTGTLGYYHDRTINLDGKVNLDALRARNEGTMGAYVAASPAAYLADWQGMTEFMRLPEVAETFEVVVDDEEANLGVLRRVRRPETAAPSANSDTSSSASAGEAP